MAVPTYYVETSCWGSLPRGQPPSRRRAVQRLLQLLDGTRGLCAISEVVLGEIALAPADEAAVIQGYLDATQLVICEASEAVETLARAYIKVGVLSQRREADALHVALATCFGCDYLVSWNHRHLTRPRKVIQYQAVNQLNGYRKTPQICNPVEASDEIRFR